MEVLHQTKLSQILTDFPHSKHSIHIQKLTDDATKFHVGIPPVQHVTWVSINMVIHEKLGLEVSRYHAMYHMRGTLPSHSPPFVEVACRMFY